jgi:hypothetical protein
MHSRSCIICDKRARIMPIVREHDNEKAAVYSSSVGREAIHTSCTKNVSSGSGPRCAAPAAHLLVHRKDYVKVAAGNDGLRVLRATLFGAAFVPAQPCLLRNEAKHVQLPCTHLCTHSRSPRKAAWGCTHDATTWERVNDNPSTDVLT